MTYLIVHELELPGSGFVFPKIHMRWDIPFIEPSTDLANTKFINGFTEVDGFIRAFLNVFCLMSDRFKLPTKRKLASRQGR
ncbi:MAG: hypothetical protein R8G34_02495 [Paracoccaceae bacterium]|nr:hypothetical protein [Paracoccaceae bacterium]